MLKLAVILADKRAHWEACALGGALYLAAGAAGLSAGPLQSTGIGCFFAPWVQAGLQVEAPAWADVCEFANISFYLPFVAFPHCRLLPFVR